MMKGGSSDGFPRVYQLFPDDILSKLIQKERGSGREGGEGKRGQSD